MYKRIAWNLFTIHEKNNHGFQTPYKNQNHLNIECSLIDERSRLCLKRLIDYLLSWLMFKQSNVHVKNLLLLLIEQYLTLIDIYSI